MIEAGGYSILLRCDTDHRKMMELAPSTSKESMLHFDLMDNAEYTGETRAECIREARKHSWLFKRDGRTFCGWCVKNGMVPK